MSIDALEAFIERGDVQLVRASSFLDPSLGRFHRRQDLPPRAKPDRATLRRCIQELRAWKALLAKAPEEFAPMLAKMMRFPPVVVASYAWLGIDHPDAEGRQLREVLAPAIEWYMSERARLIKGYAYLNAMSNVVGHNLGLDLPLTLDSCDFLIFLDYSSLWQKERDVPQEASFRRALDGMDLLYAHQETCVWRMTRLVDGHPESRPYVERGWPFFETSVSQFIKPSHLCLDLGSEVARRALAEFQGEIKEPEALAAQGKCNVDEGGGAFDKLKDARRPPLVPERFAEEVRTKAVTNGKDVDVLIQLQEKVALLTLSQSHELIFSSLGWGRSEVALLVPALQLCSSLQTLDLEDNKLDPEDAALIVDELVGLPLLTTLRLDDNSIGVEGAKALAEKLPAGLTTLWLDDNSIGDEGENRLRAAAVCMPGLALQC